MVSTNSDMSPYARFVIEGGASCEAAVDEDLGAIAVEVLRRLAPVLQYVIRTTIRDGLKGRLVTSNMGADRTAQKKAILLAEYGLESDEHLYWFLANDGKFYSLRAGYKDGGRFVYQKAFREESAWAVLKILEREYGQSPLEFLFDSLFTEMQETITQMEERLANLRGRAGWFVGILLRSE